MKDLTVLMLCHLLAYLPVHWLPETAQEFVNVW